tara:strand:+ start:1141 stop:1845 length:705 start_codon:yes stop_codon:yes gene_type:complete
MEAIPEENEVLVEDDEPITEVVDKGNETDESDGSLNSLELSELQETVTKSFEEPVPIIIKPTKPVIIKPKKATRGRPKLTPEEKKATKVVIKEKRIYMVKDENGEYKEEKIKPLTERQLKKIELEKKNTELEIEMGKKLARTKKGKVDNRSSKERTPAQIAHSKKLVEMNRLRREKKTAEKKDSLDKSIDESVKKSIVQVITAPKEMIKEVKPDWKPPPPPKKTDKQIYNDFFG